MIKGGLYFPLLHTNKNNTRNSTRGGGERISLIHHVGIHTVFPIAVSVMKVLDYCVLVRTPYHNTTSNVVFGCYLNEDTRLSYPCIPFFTRVCSDGRITGIYIAYTSESKWVCLRNFWFTVYPSQVSTYIPTLVLIRNISMAQDDCADSSLPFETQEDNNEGPPMKG